MVGSDFKNKIHFHVNKYKWNINCIEILMCDQFEMIYSVVQECDLAPKFLVLCSKNKDAFLSTVYFYA